MSFNWPEVSIENLKASTKNAIAMGPFGSRIKAENFVKEGIPIIKGGNLNGNFLKEDKFDYLTTEKANELQASNAYRRDIIITHRGTIGQVGIIPDNSKFERYVASQSQLKISLDQEKVNPYFVYYFLRSPLGQHRLLSNSSQVGVPAIAQASTSVKAIMVPCPDKYIQDKVVEILLNLDHKIELNRQTNQTLEQIAQALFKSWFVDFDPVKAKIAAKQAGGTAEQIERAAMVTISGKTEIELDQLTPEQYTNLKTTAALFPDELVDSELGEIPENWIVSKIKDFGSVVCGKTPSKTKPENYGNFMPFIKIPDMHGTMFVVQPIECLSKEGVNSQPKKIIPAGSICVSCIATVGKVVITHQNSQTNQQINCIIPFEESSSYYLYFHMTSLSKLFHDLASGGSATLNMNTSTFSNIEALKPNNEALIEFHKLISPLIKKILSNLEANRSLEELRDSLLPKLLSGEFPINKGPNNESLD